MSIAPGPGLDPLPVVRLELASWGPGAGLLPRVEPILEEGGVALFDGLRFPLEDGEERFLSPAWSDGRTKNVWLAPGGATAEGCRGGVEDRARLARLLLRYQRAASALVTALVRSWAPTLRTARTSFRPLAVTGRTSSVRNDDRRLHVDAFPASPTGGERILRLFTNLNPAEDRVWRLGEPFETAARRVLGRPAPPAAWIGPVLELLGVTRGRRTPYDSLMLRLHDGLKRDEEYQRTAPQTVVRFPPGASWLAFTDQVLHAAVSGQYLLEQTFHLPAASLAHPETSPLKVLRGLTGAPLTGPRIAEGPGGV